MIHKSYKGSDHCRIFFKNPLTGYVFFLQCRHIHIPHEFLKKSFYCLVAHAQLKERQYLIHVNKQFNVKTKVHTFHFVRKFILNTGELSINEFV